MEETGFQGLRVRVPEREKVVRLFAIFLKASNVVRLVGIVKAAGVFLVTGGLPRSLRCDTGDRGCCES